MFVSSWLLRTAVTSLCLLSCTRSLFAQYEFRPASLTTKEGNRLRGKIRFYDWDVSPKSIGFVDSLSGQEQTYPAEAVERLQIAPNKVFDGKSLAITTYPKEAVPPEVLAAIKPDSGFYLAELLYESSIMQLYRVFDQNRKLHLFLQKNDRPYALENVEYQVRRPYSTYLYQKAAYQHTLKEVLSECPTLTVDRLPYTEKAIVDLLDQYHRYCRVDSRVYLEQKKAGNYRLNIGGHYSFFLPTNITTRSDLLGLSLQLQSPQRLRTLFLLVDFGFISTLGAENFQDRFNAAIYGGRYWPLVGNKLLLMSYTGISMTRGPFDTAIGLSVRKRFSVVAGASPYRYLFGAGLAPYTSFRFVLPLN